MSQSVDKKLNLKNLIAKNIVKATVAIERELDPSSPLFNDFTLYKSMYFRAESDFKFGIIQIDERNKVYNHVSGALISLVEEIEEEDIGEYNNIQNEIEKFHDKIKEYEESSKTIEAAIYKEGEEIKTYLTSGINTLLGVSTSVEIISDKISNIEKKIQKDSGQYEVLATDITSTLMGILQTLKQNEKFQMRLIESSKSLESSIASLSQYISASSHRQADLLRDQTQVYSESIMNLIDSNAINNARLLAALESMSRFPDTK